MAALGNESETKFKIWGAGFRFLRLFDLSLTMIGYHQHCQGRINRATSLIRRMVAQSVSR